MFLLEFLIFFSRFSPVVNVQYNTCLHIRTYMHTYILWTFNVVKLRIRFLLSLFSFFKNKHEKKLRKQSVIRTVYVYKCKWPCLPFVRLFEVVFHIILDNIHIYIAQPNLLQCILCIYIYIYVDKYFEKNSSLLVFMCSLF